ncbi:MAG TPA: cytochrome P450 [Acidimicrobiales bacterium]|nr:cytochrome P450 [Acidimicrobiales bacterium]
MTDIVTSWPATPDEPPPDARLVADIVDVDLTRGATFLPGVPHDAFDELRRHGGIAWHAEAPVAGLLGDDNPLLQFVDSPGFWVVTSHDLVSEVDRDQARFSSEAGGTFMPSLTDDSLAMFRQMMLNMDHPRHTRLRRILQPIFTPRSIERLRASVEANAADIAGVLTSGDGAGEVDLVTAVSAEMPLRVLADLFGMPQEDRHLIYGWSNALLGADNPGAAQHAEDSMTALAGMMAYGQAMAEDRRAAPRDDIVSRIVTAEVDGERLTDDEFQMFWLLLVVAGNETTRNGVSGSVVALHEHDLWSWLATHLEHLPTAVEELLRYVSPVQHFRRTATGDVVLGDQRVRAGDKVVIWFGAANRDPDVFTDPHRLDLLRDPNPHLALGVGPHFCLGAHLARLEMTEMLRSLLAVAPDLTIGEPGRIASNFINGVHDLAVSVGTGAR